MIDFAKITAIAGSGGQGAGSFTHIKGKRLGKADGGDGGRGGHVYIETTGDLNTLEPFRFIKEYKAQGGGNGSSQRRKGADGEDLVVKVPVGTMVKVKSQSQSEESKSARKELSTLHSDFDLVAEGQKILVARGGEGGRGNAHLRDEFGRRPKSAELGDEGETINLTLELKLIADIGLIGLPNAGKSTLLSRLTAATPKVAPYPFTTLEPNLGVVDSLQFTVHSSQKASGKTTVNRQPLTVNKPAQLVIADIPGLIEGASEGRGLGHIFLRHIERTKMLVHLIDISTPGDKWQDYQTVRGELKKYSKELIKKKEIILLTKIDMVNEIKARETLDFFKGKKKKVLAISAVSGKGLDELVGYWVG